MGLGAIAIGGIAGGLWKKGQDQAKKNMANYNALQRENSKFLKIFFRSFKNNVSVAHIRPYTGGVWGRLFSPASL